MADQPVTREKLINADKDVQVIEDFIKKPKDETVTTRFGDKIMTLKGLEEEVKKSGGYFKRYTSLVSANADIANIPVDSVVKVTSATDGGDYEKVSAEATALTKSPYDPVEQAKAYIAESEKKAEIYTDISSDISLRKLARTSSNLFNEATATKGNKLIDASGNIVSPTNADTDWAYTDYVKVDAQKSYYVDGFRSVAFYDESLNFISRITMPTTGTGTALDPYKYHGAITLPTNAKFIRANYRLFLNTDFTDGRKINEGSVSLPYEPFSLSLNKSVSVSGVNLESKSVSVSAIEFIEESKNLFNPAAVTNGKVILDTGAISDNAGYAISEFISVKGGQKYTISSSSGVVAFTNICYYDSGKNFIQRSSVSMQSPIVVSVPFDAAYVRFNLNVTGNGAPSTGNRMFNFGDQALPYEAWYKPKLVGVETEVEVNRDDVVAIVEEHISDLPLISSFIEPSYNLFNAQSCIVGKAIDVSGNIIDNAAYAISDFIHVESGQSYTISGELGKDAFIYACYFDINKQFIARINSGSSATGYKVLKIPTGTVYVRFNINMANTGLPEESLRMFTKGSLRLPYVKYGDELSLSPTPEYTKDLSEHLKLKRKDNFIFDYDLTGLFTTPETLGSYLSFNSSTSAQVYQMYDDLMTAHPNHITKQNLGNDAWGNPIALYRFKAPQPVTAQRTKTPKVFLTTGVHGMEHVAVLTAYLMFEQILNNWKSSKLLEVLRNNVEFLIIPVCNPSGYNKYTRKNDNGVDLNRNFPDGFGWQSTDPASAYYGGAAPLDQLESQYIARVFEENLDIDIMYDFHNFNGTSAADHPHLVWIAAYTGAQYVEHMTQSLVRKLTNHWRDKFTWIPESDTWFAGFSNATEGGMIKDYAVHSRGISFTATFEVGGKWWIDPAGVSYDLNHKQSCLEALVNFILINLNELKRI